MALIKFGIGVVLASVVSTAYAETTIDLTNGPQIADASFLPTWYRQTFTTPTIDSQLTDISLYVRTPYNTYTSWVNADLYLWDSVSSGYVGSSLWSSGATAVSSKSFADSQSWTGAMSRLDFDMNLTLQENTQYAFAYYISGGAVGLLASTNYLGGKYETYWGDRWQEFVGSSAPLVMTFESRPASPVPEPQAYLLMLAGLSAIALTKRFQKYNGATRPLLS